MSVRPKRKTSSAATEAAAADVCHDICACALEDFVVVPPAAPVTTSASSTAPVQESRRGVLRYVGPVDFADGLWAGVELVGTFGRNDGSVKGKRYFSCLSGQGLFVRPDTVRPYVPDATSAAPETPTPHADLEKETASLRKSLDTALSRNIDLEMTVDDLTAQLKRAQAASGTAVEEKKVPVTFSSPPSPSGAHPVEAPLTVSERIQLEMDMMELKDELAAAQRALRTAESTVAQLRRESSSTAATTVTAGISEDSVRALREQLSAKEQECAKLRAERNTLHASPSAAVTAPAAHVLAAAHSSADVSPDLRTLTEKMQTLESANRRLIADMEALRAEAAAAEAASTAKLESVEQSHARAAAAWEKERRTLSAVQHTLTEKVTSLEAQLQEQSEAHVLSAVSAETAVRPSEAAWAAKLREADASTQELRELLELTEHELLEEKKQTDQLSEVVRRLRDKAQAHTDDRAEQLAALEVQNQRQSQDLLEAQRQVNTLHAQLQAALAENQTMRRGHELERAPSTSRTTPSGDLEVNEPTAERQAAALQTELDTVKLRLFQLQKEAAADGQLRARFDAVCKELTAVRAESRQQLENVRAEYAAAQAEFASTQHALRSQVDELTRQAAAQARTQAEAAPDGTSAVSAPTLDEMERRRYLRWLIYGLDTSPSSSSPSSASPVMGCGRCVRDEARALVALPLVSSYRNCADNAQAESSLASSLSSPVRRTAAETVARCHEATRLWREQAADHGDVTGLLDFTTASARSQSVKLLFSR